MIEIICIISIIFNLIFGITICYLYYIKLKTIHKISEKALKYLNDHRVNVVFSDDVETFLVLENSINLINILTKHYDTKSKES